MSHYLPLDTPVVSAIVGEAKWLRTPQSNYHEAHPMILLFIVLCRASTSLIRGETSKNPRICPEALWFNSVVDRKFTLHPYPDRPCERTRRTGARGNKICMNATPQNICHVTHPNPTITPQHVGEAKCAQGVQSVLNIVCTEFPPLFSVFSGRVRASLVGREPFGSGSSVSIFSETTLRRVHNGRRKPPDTPRHEPEHCSGGDRGNPPLNCTTVLPLPSLPQPQCRLEAISTP